jgi:serine/threonine protein kinase
MNATAPPGATVVARAAPAVRNETPSSASTFLLPDDPRASTWMPTEIASHGRTPLEAGRRVGRYYLVEPIGAGGQAGVWRARRAGAGGGEVALKILTAESARDRRRVARLRREALRGARLSHPALLPAYEFDAADGVVFLAMPLVEGVSLEEVVAQRLRLDRVAAARHEHWLARVPESHYVRHVVAALARVARALHTAHLARVAHRDIKPSNILIDRRGLAYLADFGLGRDLDVARVEHLRDWSGSPLYMAPEKLLGRHDDEIRCDIYALGATVFEALTLHRPWPVPEGLTGPALWLQMANVAMQGPPRARALRPDLDPRLEAILLTAMAVRPQHRHPTAAALAHAWECWLRDSPAPHATPAPHAQRRRPSAAP